MPGPRLLAGATASPESAARRPPGHERRELEIRSRNREERRQDEREKDKMIEQEGESLNKKRRAQAIYYRLPTLAGTK